MTSEVDGVTALLVSAGYYPGLVMTVRGPVADVARPDALSLLSFVTDTLLFLGMREHSARGIEANHLRGAILPLGPVGAPWCLVRSKPAAKLFQAMGLVEGPLQCGLPGAPILTFALHDFILERPTLALPPGLPRSLQQDLYPVELPQSLTLRSVMRGRLPIQLLLDLLWRLFLC